MDYNGLSWIIIEGVGYHGVSMTVIDDFHGWLSWEPLLELHYSLSGLLAVAKLPLQEIDIVYNFKTEVQNLKISVILDRNQKGAQTI